MNERHQFDDTRLVRAEEVAKMFQLTPRTIYLMAERGELPVVHVGRRAVRFDPQALRCKEMRARMLSLAEALELAADVSREDRNELARWREFIQNAHARGDFRWLHELTRKEFAAVKFGRPVEVYSQPEIRSLFARVGATEFDKVKDKTVVAARNSILTANREGRIYSGPMFTITDPTGKPLPSTFRSAADPLREETREEIEREIDGKLNRLANVAEINEAINLLLERAAQRMTNGEAVIPSVDMWRMLERGIAEIIKVSESPNRFTDVGTYPRWNELMRVYNEVRGKLNISTVDPIADSMNRLGEFWKNQDAEYSALSEKVTGSADEIPQDVLERSLGMLGFMAQAANAA